MASGTRVVTGTGSAIFDFVTVKRGIVSFFSNDLNISFNCQVDYPGATLRLHTGPILFIASSDVDAGGRVTIVATAIAGGFPPPPLSLLQLQTDTIRQTPTAAETEVIESDPWDQS